ncbi:hypothetical protein QQF64_008364 [Cirrhinus molitorella]|uniref:Uncharacterized protein n=1 Tax=Cirrhinus molitorella TaxID=172907 RepID=A0ABR3M5Z8_9TELE
MGLTKCQKPRLWWDSNPQPLNGLTRQSRSPMRYPLRHRARRGTRLGHVKAFLPDLWPSSWANLHAVWAERQLSHGARLFRFVRLGRYPSKAGEGVASQGKPPAVLTLLRVPTRRPFLKKRLLGRIEARDQRHRWDSNPGSPVY